jgi:hypothetical protein
MLQIPAGTICIEEKPFSMIAYRHEARSFSTCARNGYQAFRVRLRRPKAVCRALSPTLQCLRQTWRHRYKPVFVVLRCESNIKFCTHMGGFLFKVDIRSTGVRHFLVSATCSQEKFAPDLFLRSHNIKKLLQLFNSVSGGYLFLKCRKIFLE